MHFKGTAHRYGRDIDTDVIIPARYLNSSDPEWLAAHCLEDLDKDFVKKVHKGDIIVAEENFGCGSSREHAPIAIKAVPCSRVGAANGYSMPRTLRVRLIRPPSSMISRMNGGNGWALPLVFRAGSARERTPVPCSHALAHRGAVLA